MSFNDKSKKEHDAGFTTAAGLGELGKVFNQLLSVRRGRPPIEPAAATLTAKVKAGNAAP